MKSRTSWPAMHALMASILAFTMPLAAVELSPSGEGGALIFPIWATTNGHLSVLSVVDAQSQTRTSGLPVQAAKLLLRDAQGALLFSANIYTRTSEDTWSASLVALPDGRSRLASSDDSCVLVGEPGAVTPWSGSVDLDADYGFIEVVAMATFGSEGGDGSCAGLAARWNGGIWSQDPAVDLAASNADAALRGTLNLVNVPKGTSYSIPATALREFSDIGQHTAPASALPNLTSAHDSGTAANATRSRVCDARTCIESTWELPRNAVAAALTASELRGDYSNSPTLAGKTDLVFSYPLRHQFAQGDMTWIQHPRVYMSAFDRSGTLIGDQAVICPGTYPPGGCSPGPTWILGFPDSVTALSLQFGLLGDTSPLPSEVLGISHTPLASISSPLFPEGSYVAKQGGFLVSNEGRFFNGLPVIGVGLQQFENGNLLGDDGVQQRANYGVAVPMTRRMEWP